MILNPIKIENLKLLEIPVDIHMYTWEYYFRQYATVLNHIIKVSLEKKYKLNIMQMAVMYVFRHTVELFLKMKLEQTGKRIPNTHNLIELALELDDLQLLTFIEKADVLRPNEEGDCFRYLNDKSGKQHFSNEQLCVLPVISLFVSIARVDIFKNILQSMNVTDKKLCSEWNFYTIDSGTLGHIRTQYDFLISSLLSSIKDEELKIDHIYIPILFLLRHSLELAFKHNISEIEDSLTKSQQKKCDEHSLLSLFLIINQFVEKAKLSITESDIDIQHDLEKYVPLTEKHTKVLHELDVRSLSFRFPVDQKGEYMKILFSPNSLSDVISTYETADPFITFSLQLLKYENLLGPLDYEDM